MTTRIFFFTVAIIILFGMTLATVRAYTSGFRMTAHHTQNAVLATLLLPMFYLGSIVGGRAKVFGRIPYTIINIAAGLFFYLFIGAVVIGLSFPAAMLLNVQVALWFVWTIFLASLAIGITALVQSRFIQIKKYVVTLKNAPDSWNGKTAVLVTDTHFGLVNHVRFADKIVNKILLLAPDFVLHGGDFYDGPSVATEPLTASWKKLTATIPLFYTPGNHETYGDYAGFVESIRATGATVLDNKMTTYDGVQIAGITYREGKENPEADSALAALGLDTTKPVLLINHPPTALMGAERDGVDLMVSGHTHNGQFWPLNYVVKKVYGAFAYGHNKYNNMDVITSNGAGTYGPPMRLFNSPEVVHITFKTN